jgi:hypothetical protein
MTEKSEFWEDDDDDFDNYNPPITTYISSFGTLDHLITVTITDPGLASVPMCNYAYFLIALLGGLRLFPCPYTAITLLLVCNHLEPLYVVHQPLFLRRQDVR